MRLFTLVCALCIWGGTSYAQVTFLGSYVWENDDPLFGGVSGIEVVDGGATFIVIGDRGASLSANVTRQNGAITQIQTGAILRTRGPSGKVLDTGETDSEGLAFGPNGRIYVSFEGEIPRILHYDGQSEAGVALPLPRDFAVLQGNSGLEALAVDHEGTLIAIPERSGRANRPFPLYRFQNENWDIPTTLPRIGPFLVVGADFGPDGLLYILERDFTGFGFRSRVRRINLGNGAADTILETGIGVHDNLEGISLWVNDAGETIMTLVADDNFSRFQQTEVVEYRIDG